MKKELDILEETAKRVNITRYELFREICSCSEITAKRLDALWCGYRQELFIPDFVEAACLKILMGTTGR